MELINRIRKSRKGFTLVEIIVVLVILAILAAFTIPTMLGFVSDAKGKALVAEAREVYVAAQATATESAGKNTTFTKEDLGSANVKTNTAAASKQMNTYLIDDIVPVTLATDATTTKPNNAYWTVTLDATNTAKVTSVVYTKAGYKITIDKTASGVGTTTEKLTS